MGRTKSRFSNNKNPLEINVENFVRENKNLLKKCEHYRIHFNNLKYVTHVNTKMLKKYKKTALALIITANNIEKETLYAYAFKHNRTPFVSIVGKKNKDLIYTFFAFSSMIVAHVEVSTGSYSDGGAFETIKNALDELNPNIVILLGVAFGYDCNKSKLGDVIVGRQHFSYDNGQLAKEGMKYKKLHLEEADSYMLNRFKTVMSLDAPQQGEFNNRFKLVHGNMITGDFVVNDNNFRTKIFKPFEAFDVVGGDMEAKGGFRIVRENKKHCILIKGICDWGAGKNSLVDGKNPKDNLQTLSALNACIVCSQLLRYSELYSDSKTLRKIKKLRNATKKDIINLAEYIL